MKKFTIASVFALVAFVLSYGILVPKGLGVLNVVGSVATVGGYGLSLYIKSIVKSKLHQMFILVFSSVLSGVAFVQYVMYLNVNPSGLMTVWYLAFLIFGAFFFLANTMGVAGVLLETSAKE